MLNNVEEWRDISGYDGLYKVSNRGRIKAIMKDIKNLEY